MGELGEKLDKNSMAVKNMLNKLKSKAVLKASRGPCTNPWPPGKPTLWGLTDMTV